ncbi:tRNA (N(6)-L-threonylcarbamoyladenosine(37)-C(2))-methylthiotransferase MtaB [uncultured Sphaerochaeta sp.]|uniref:tRNA (N(6)-L-threonylcarbamoyladenosine(37)-C(2))- methylthiotransferase MtaB n=1 Tax=uncultured Sphaerochaeta sp. TaxID=886478 RepID=UPI002A0A965E|nr:tRNA (N(6)-L-threonylcarbamoyladenosine(37)-C(2))-methylthiotransferase MtaB [uncultured Sphaerochaeta sp.]
MNVCVYTLGCRLNQCESEAIADSFAQEGFTIVGEEIPAELYIVNTCTVTSKAEQKARRMIRKFAAMGVTVATGCYAQVNEEELASLSENVIVVPLEKKAHLLKLAKHLNTSFLSGFDLRSGCLSFSDGKASVFDYDAASFSYHSRAYLKVQDGCDNACAYCRVHIARGKALSLDSDTVVERALALEEAGFSEIMLTGVNLTMYDHRKDGLGGLLEKLLVKLGPSIRLRLSSLEPDHIDDRLLDTLQDYRMQPHFHIPVQSASDKVLIRVNRHYSVEHLTSILERLRQVKDDPFLAADVITGLPAEGDAEFEETFRYFENQKFAQMHVFPFSPRPDTALYLAHDKVPESLRDERALRLRQLSQRLHAEYLARQSGKETEVILQNRKGGYWSGLTGNYIDVKVLEAPPFSKEGLLLKGTFGKITEKTAKPAVLCHA